MSETTANLLVALIGALGSVLTVVAVYLTRRALAYLDSKTRFLDDQASVQKKEALQRRIEDLVRTAVGATQQTFVDGLKAKSADGKLTGEEASEALQRTRDAVVPILGEEGIDIGRDALDLLVEAAVHKLKENKALGQVVSP